jgi:hypothetical protein
MVLKITIDLPAVLPSTTFGVVPFGKNSALPGNDTTTASSGCDSVDLLTSELLTSQTTTRSFSITGFSAVCAPPWNNIAKSSRVRTTGEPF